MSPTFFDLATLEFSARDFARARAYGEEALELAESVGDIAAAIEADVIVASCELITHGDVERARRGLGRAIERCADYGYDEKLDLVIWSCAGYAVSVDRPSEGVRLLGASSFAGTLEGGDVFAEVWRGHIWERIEASLDAAEAKALLDEGAALGPSETLALARSVLESRVAPRSRSG